MRVACLQFGPELGKVKENMEKADAILARTRIPADLDWLVLPEMAFSGYNFYSLEHISPYLESTTAGPTTQWALRTAARLNCLVTVGYPELTTISPPPSTSNPASSASTSPSPSTSNNPEQPRRYNSTVTVSPTGAILANYRKSFLYYTDETWAEEGNSSAVTPNAIKPKSETANEKEVRKPPVPTGPSVFSLEALNAPPPSPPAPAPTTDSNTAAPPANPSEALTSPTTGSVIPVPASTDKENEKAAPFLTLPLPLGPAHAPIPVTLGICMDINPYRFTAPWSAFEFPTSMLAHSSHIACLSTAWLTARPLESLAIEPNEPDLDTVAYWIERFHCLVEKSGIDAFGGAAGGVGRGQRDENGNGDGGANEKEKEEAEPYIIILANRTGIEGGVGYAGSSCVLRIERGTVSLYDRLGKSEEAVLLVDTEERPRYDIRAS